MESYLKKGDQPRPIKPSGNPARLAGLKSLAGQIRRLMAEDKAFQDPTLSLQSLAERLDVKPYRVSQCLKEVMAVRFTDDLLGQPVRNGSCKCILQRAGTKA